MLADVMSGQHCGVSACAELLLVTQANAEQAVRQLLRDFSQEQGLKEVDTVSGEEHMDDGTPIRLAVTIDRKEGSALLDFEGVQIAPLHGQACSACFQLLCMLSVALGCFACFQLLCIFWVALHALGCFVCFQLLCIFWVALHAFSCFACFGLLCMLSVALHAFSCLAPFWHWHAACVVIVTSHMLQ